MFAPTPAALLREQLDTLIQHLPGMRDGSETDVHRGRVATRRMHEILLLVRPRFGERETSYLIERLRGARRALGRVRDADTMQNLLGDLDARFPVSRAIVADLRARVRDEQGRTRRRLIKRLETLDLEELPAHLSRLRRRHLRLLPSPSGRPWRQMLREHVAGRAVDARRAVDHATGVYFPNRAHGARIALKKLRYALELGEATRTLRLRRGLDALREVQDVLGEAHDREVLMARVRAGAVSAIAWPAAELEPLLRFLHDETQRLYTAYLARRDDVVAAADEAAQSAGRAFPAAALLAAAAAVPSAWLLARGREAADLEVTVRTSLPDPPAPSRPTPAAS